MATHRLEPTAKTVSWCIFDAAYPPLITVNSGDTVVLECVSGGPEVMPPPGSGLRIPPALAAIHAANLRRVGGHILTGPVGVAGAEPGDMLEVHIDKIELGADQQFSLCRMSGFLRPSRRVKGSV
jgi:acetamidase/formamidase